MIKKGDLIIFDDVHELLCGDATSDDVKYLLTGGEKNSGNTMLYTDPPYNAEFNGRSGDHDIIMNDSMEENDFYNFIRAWYINMKKYFTTDIITYIWCNNYLKSVIERIHPQRWLLPNKKPIIWVKNNFGMGRNYRPKYEMLLFDGKIDEEILNECDVWKIKKDNGTHYIHPTQKPIECFARGMRNHKKIKYVVDCFAGSGSSLIASVEENKTWLGMELDPKYCDKIIKRYYDYTLSKNIKIIRDGQIILFDTILKQLNLLIETDTKGNKAKNEQFRLL